MLKILLSYDFRHTAFNQLWKLVSGPLLLVLIPIYLTPETQGYWFSFISLAALAVFADMGFSTILLQFSAHEFAHLKFINNKTLEGKKEHLIRIASLFRFAVKWAAIIAVIVFPFILFLGCWVFNSRAENINWFIPWLIYGLASVLVFINSIILAFIEGCDSVGDIQKIRFNTSIIVVLTTVILLVSNQGLFSLAISLLLGSIVGFLLILLRYRFLLLQLMSFESNKSHSWVPEILPLMWRYAISWVSGFFIFSIFTPLAFHYYGAIEAGQVGLSIAVFSAIYSISNIFILIIIPKINIYIAHFDYEKLNSLFIRNLIISMLTYFIGIITLFLVLWMLKGSKLDLSNRLVTMYSLVILAIAWFFQLIISSLAVYMRAHKKEPLVWVSLGIGIYISCLTWLIACHSTFDNYFLGFLSSYLFASVFVFFIFKSFIKGINIENK